MKNIFLLGFTIIFMLITTTSCDNTDNEIKTVHEDSKMIISKIGEDTQGVGVVQEYFKDFNNYDLQFDMVRKTNFKSFKEVDFYLIPTTDPNVCIGHYTGKGKNFDIKIIKQQIDNDKDQFTALDLNNKILYTYVISKKIGFTDFTSYNNDIKTTFSKTNGGGIVGDYPADYNCGKLNFQKCVLCAVDVCSQDWRCALAALAFGWEFAAGVAIVCAI
jgi:hypothetical protein